MTTPSQKPSEKKLLRLVCNVPPRTHTAPLMEQLKILNIYNLYKYRTAIEVLKQIQIPRERTKQTTTQPHLHCSHPSPYAQHAARKERQPLHTQAKQSTSSNTQLHTPDGTQLMQQSMELPTTPDALAGVRAHLVKLQVDINRY